MKKLHSPIVLLASLLSASAACAADSADVNPAGQVSAWGSTLDDMTRNLQAAFEKAGTNGFKLTSARAGNRYYCTVLIYK